MSKRDQMKSDYAKVAARYGKDYGAGNGKKPAPPAKVKPIIKKGTIGIKVTKKF